MKSLFKALLPFLKPVAVRVVTREIEKRQAKLDVNDKSDAVQIDVLEFAKHQIANL
jgi:hypothetical protein